MEYLPLKAVYVVIVNYNGWADTIECLESVLRSNYEELRVIVIDNASHDSSLDFIKAWADNRLDSMPPLATHLRSLVFPPVPKPLPYVEYNHDKAISGGASDDINASLILIRNSVNQGFAGGNNVGIEYILARDDFSYIWLLNNDTVVDVRALSSLVSKMENNPHAGICGSTLLYYSEYDRIQALGGGYYCKPLGLSWHLGWLRRTKSVINAKRVERSMNYVVGASMLLSREFINDIGLMSEDYFLFFEEMDWSMRAGNDYNLMYSPESRVYHKVGKSIGTSSYPGRKSLLCEYFNIRNRLYFTHKYYKHYMLPVSVTIFISLIMRLLSGRFDNFSTLLKLFNTYKRDIAYHLSVMSSSSAK